MFFCREIVVPSGIDKENPLRETLLVSYGFLCRVAIRWRYGSSYLCGLRIKYHEFQICPLSLDEWIVSMPDLLSYEENIAIDSQPYELTIELYNSDDTFEHRVWIGLIISREENEYIDLRALQSVLGYGGYYG